jgi:carbon-monoxide dehydrogenase iron sulfur subunit
MNVEPGHQGGRPDEEDLSRRDFLRRGAAPVVAFIALEAIGGLGLATGTTPKETKLSTGVIFPDPSLCIGCLTCEVICSQEHKREGLAAVPRIRIFNDPATQVAQVIKEAYPDRGQFHQEPCLQCPTAECLYVCPVDALQVEPRTGARFIREDTCVSCGRCAEACPFPISDESKATHPEPELGQKTRISYDKEADTFAKCDLCYWRNGGPACVERCPVNVRIRQGIIKSDHLCLDAPAGSRENWARLREFQTFGDSPAKGKA